MKTDLPIDHDVPPGPLNRCQVSGSDNLHLVIDLGHQPPCDSLLTGAQLDQPEQTYPLRLYHCPDSGLAQLDYAVPGEELYPVSYPYVAGISWPVVEHHKALAAEIHKRVDVSPNGYPVAVDIGSNDGTLLAQLKARGFRVCGVEPTDVAHIATEAGVETVQAFFTERTGRQIREIVGPADVIACTNAFAHMATLGEVLRGICRLLAPHGLVVVEVQYLLAMLQKNQFDGIYHEHLRSYSLKSLVLLFAQYGLEVVEAEYADRYAGNLRVYVGWAGVRPVEASVALLLRAEDDAGLHSPDTWCAWRQRVLCVRDEMMEALYRWRAQGRRVAGVSCPGRCSTLLNWYGIGPELIEYLGELPTSRKLGLFTPGRHIPVVSNEYFAIDKPDVLVLMAWHYGGVIVERLRREGFKGKIAAPLPFFRTVQ